MQLLIPGNIESYTRKKYHHRTLHGLVRNNVSTVKKQNKNPNIESLNIC